MDVVFFIVEFDGIRVHSIHSFISQPGCNIQQECKLNIFLMTV